MKRLLLLLVLAGCVPLPKRDYTDEEIKHIDELEEIMRVQAKTMDPQFKKADQAAFTDDEFAQLAAAGHRIQVTSQTLLDKFVPHNGKTFGPWATQLHTHAEELTAAADAKDAAKTRQALHAVKDACAGCHKDNR